MKKAYINSLDSETVLSEYQVKVEYSDGNVLNKNINQYSYTRVFEWIKENHEYEKDQKVKSIKIDLIK